MCGNGKDVIFVKDDYVHGWSGIADKLLQWSKKMVILFVYWSCHRDVRERLVVYSSCIGYGCVLVGMVVYWLVFGKFSEISHVLVVCLRGRHGHYT